MTYKIKYATGGSDDSKPSYGRMEFILKMDVEQAKLKENRFQARNVVMYSSYGNDWVFKPPTHSMLDTVFSTQFFLIYLSEKYRSISL